MVDLGLQGATQRATPLYLTGCIHEFVLECQLPHTRQLIFTITDQNVNFKTLRGS